MGLTLADVATIADIIWKLCAAIVMAILIWNAIDSRRRIEKLEDLHDGKD